MRRTGRAGVSLVELMVAMAIGSALLTVVVSAFVGARQLLTWMGARTDVAAAALLGANSIGREIRSSTYDTLTISTTPSPPAVALSFEVQDPTTVLNSTTLPLFQPPSYFVIYYVDGPGKLMRKTLKAGDPDVLNPAPAFGTTTRLSETQLWRSVHVRNRSEQPVAFDIASATFNPPTFPTQDEVDGVSVQLTVQETFSSRKTVQQQVLTTVYPRN